MYFRPKGSYSAFKVQVESVSLFSGNQTYGTGVAIIVFQELQEWHIMSYESIIINIVQLSKAPGCSSQYNIVTLDEKHLVNETK